MFQPRQLMLITSLAERASLQTGGGTLVEAGCAYGATTVFLNRPMNSFRHNHTYAAIDTFSGFTAKDVEHEIKERVRSSESSLQFIVNAKKWFDSKAPTAVDDARQLFQAT